MKLVYHLFGDPQPIIRAGRIMIETVSPRAQQFDQLRVCWHTTVFLNQPIVTTNDNAWRATEACRSHEHLMVVERSAHIGRDIIGRRNPTLVEIALIFCQRCGRVWRTEDRCRLGRTVSPDHTHEYMT